MRQNFKAQFNQFLKRWLCDMQSGAIVEKNQAFSVDQCQLQELQFLVHLINLLSILQRCSGFTEIQKAVVDQSDNRPPNSDHDLFLGGASLALGSALEIFLGPITELVIASCHIKSTFNGMSQSNQETVHCFCIE